MGTAWTLLVTQLLIYAAGWRACESLVSRFQETSRDLSRSAFCFALAIALSRIEETQALQLTPSLLIEFAKTLGFLYVSSACTAFFSRPALASPAQRWLLAALLSLPAQLPDPGGHLHSLISSGINACIPLITLQRIYPAILDEFGHQHRSMILLVLVLFAGLLFAESMQGFSWVAHPQPTDSPVIWPMLFMVLNGILYLSTAVMVGIRLVRETHEQAIHDPLTGILNRRGLHLVFEQFQAAHVRQKKPFSFLLADIDHFKEINDRHGHAAGDQILIEVADALGAEIRAADAIARLGGEEFLILLGDTDLPYAFALAERLRENIALHTFQYQGKRIHVTLSIGVSQSKQLPEAFSATLERADQAMYAAKRAGRNRCFAAGTP